MNNVSVAKFGAKFIAYTVMDKSKIINKLTERLSGGKVSLDTLAKYIISNTMSLGQQHIVNQRTLGKRSAEIVNQVRGLLFDNTQRQVDNGIASFTELILKSKGMSPQIQHMASSIAQFFGPRLIGENCLERVLRALTSEAGGEGVLKMALQNALAGITGGKIISASFMSALNRAILDPKLPYDKPNILHKVIAWKLHQSLSTDPSTLPPPPQGLESFETMVSAMSGFMTATCKSLDSLQKRLGLPLREQELSSVYTECWPSDLAVKETTDKPEFVKMVLKAYATDQESILDKHIDHLPDGVRAAYQQQCHAIRSVIARMPEPVIKVAQNWSGDIETLNVSLLNQHPPTSRLVEFMDTEFRAPVHHPENAGPYFADGAFINAFKAGIDLTVDNGYQSYGRWLTTMGTQLISATVNNWVGPQTLSVAQQRQLGQLAEMVNHNPLSLMAISRYLIPESITHVMQEQVLSQFTRRQPDLILVDNVWLHIDKPYVSFVVSKYDGVNINITLSWPVIRFGQSVDVLNHAEKGLNALSSQINVKLLFNEHGLEQQKISVVGTRLSLREKITFTPASPENIDPPLAFLPRGCLKKAVEVVSSC